MSLSHDEQPLTRRQLRELERQKPRKEREADAKAAEEAEAARKAEAERAAAESAADGAPAPAAGTTSRRALREQGPAEPVAPVLIPADTLPVDDDPRAEVIETAEVVDEPAESPAAPDAPSDDEPVDDTEPATRVQSVIDVVPLTEPAFVRPGESAQAAFADEGDDDEPQQAEVIAASADTGETETVVEEMVIDPPAPAVAPTDNPTPAPGTTPPLAPIFQSPGERDHVTADVLPSSFDDLISVRNAAAANSISTTSALVLPTVPGSNDVGTALDETGEVIITGSIDLPASFGAMGAPASGLEAHDLDTLLERNELEQTGSDVAPVSAARAISTNTSSTSLIAPPKRARANAPVVLAITAGVLAVGVVSLLLAVFVFRVF